MEKLHKVLEMELKTHPSWPKMFLRKSNLNLKLHYIQHDFIHQQISMFKYSSSNIHFSLKYCHTF